MFLITSSLISFIRFIPCRIIYHWFIPHYTFDGYTFLPTHQNMGGAGGSILLFSKESFKSLAVPHCLGLATS